jgi:hypothetical protein
LIFEFEEIQNFDTNANEFSENVDENSKVLAVGEINNN